MDDASRRIEMLERRVAALERRRPPVRAAPPLSGPGLKELEQLRRRRGPRYVRGSLRGAVVYAGALRAGERESLWIKEHGVAELWEADPKGLARVMAALSHPARLALARALLEAPRTSQELQEVMGTASAGQLYHHLKELVAAGVVSQSARSRYEVSAERAIPLLALLAAAADVLHPQTTDAGEPGTGEES